VREKMHEWHPAEQKDSEKDVFASAYQVKKG
jgi:hypothetical protein